jgi:predicted nucleic acid-binding protein
MPSYFVDSSALVKRYHLESGTHRVNEILNGADRIFISRLAQLEVTAALTRRARAAGVPTHDIQGLLQTFDADITDAFDVVELDRRLLEDAMRLTTVHGLRAADAIQLASAVVAHAEAGAAEFYLLGSDQELNAAAAAEGLTTMDPTQ